MSEKSVLFIEVEFSASMGLANIDPVDRLAENNVLPGILYIDERCFEKASKIA